MGLDPKEISHQLNGGGLDFVLVWECMIVAGISNLRIIDGIINHKSTLKF